MMKINSFIFVLQKIKSGTFCLCSLLSILCLSFYSCLPHEEKDIFPTLKEEQIYLQVRVPGLSLPTTRGLSSADESFIETLDLLVFVEQAGVERFAYHKSATQIASTSTGEYTFSVPVLVSEANEKYRFVLIANMRNEIMAVNFSTSDTKQAALAKITFSPANRWGKGKVAGTSSYLPMCGESNSLYVITSDFTGAELGTISLLRAVARINVGINMPSGSDVPAGLGDTFYIEEIQVRNVAASGMVYQTTPLPSGSATLNYEHLPADNKGFINEIYLAETNKSSVPYLLIGAYYTAPGASRNTTDKTWYKIILYDHTQTNPYNSVLDLLRNHTYRVNITGVSAPGYISLNDAISNSSIDNNLKVQFTVYHNKDEVNHIVYNEAYMLGVTGETITVEKDAQSDLQFIIETTFASGWSLDKVTNGSWLSGYSSSGSSGKSLFIFNVTANPSATDRTATLSFSAGTLRQEVKIVQKGS